MAIRVKKRSGRLQAFRADKIIRSVVRAGSAKTLARDIASKVKMKVYDKIRSSSLRRMVINLLSKKSKRLAESYKAFRKKMRKK